MASYGFSSDHVNLIADNLRDRYKNGFPILKELIQNADDAKSQRLAFGLHPGFKGRATHLLLQGPGLWLFNDGEFKPEDEKAIRSFGLNSKAGDSGSIGKFGLGMKSVFHLCEAFFYVAFDGQKNIDVFLNPWHDLSGNDQFHTSWNEVAPDEFESIRTVVTASQLTQGCKTWFLLWIPLRQRAHVPHQDGKPIGAIVDKYPGDPGSSDMSFLVDSGLGRKIRAVVPLLRNLETIELVNRKEDVHQFDGFKIQIAVKNESHRVDHSSPNLQSAGTVTGGVPSKGKMRFLIQQKSLKDATPFVEFQKLNAWPKTGSLNKEGKRESVPDKSDAEGAIMVAGAAADGERAKLDIQWAVFLPTEEGLNYEFLLEKSVYSYRIVLHGQFFVDAGRRGIAGSAHLSDKAIAPAPDLDDTDLHTGWNQAVAQRVVLPMFLPTVAQYAAEHLNSQETEELARAILEARSAITHSGGIGKGFWETFKSHICNAQAWVRLVTPNGPKWSLERVTTDTRLLKLPPPPRDDSGRPWQVLPGLARLAKEGCLFLDDTAPSLLITYSNWDDQTLDELLHSLDQRAACTATGLTYLTCFLRLEQARYVNTAVVQRALITVMKNILRKESLQTLRGVRSAFQELVALVKSEFRFAIGLARAQSEDDEVLKSLLNSNTQKLLLPKDLDPASNPSCGVPTEKEVHELFATIDKQVADCDILKYIDSERKINGLLRASTDILKLLPDKGKDGDERSLIVRANQSLRVLSAICARTGKNRAVSLSQLINSHQNGLVFKQEAAAGGVIYPVATALAKLIPLEQIWVVSAEISKWIQSAGDQRTSTVPSATNQDAAYSALGKQNHLLTLTGTKNERMAFIQQVPPNTIKGEDMIRGYRYVLHGDSRKHGVIDEPLWINADRENEVWLKLKNMVDPDPWNLVDPDLTAVIHLRREDKEKCGIQNLGLEEVLTHLKNTTATDKIIASRFDESERIAILLKISDEALWKTIPLHIDSNGRFGQITKNGYIDPKSIAISSLTHNYQIFKLSENEALKIRQEKIIQEWTHKTTIERALAQTNPENYCDAILNALNNISAGELSQITALKSIKWLPLNQTNHSISPEDVIDLESLTDEIDRLAAENNYCYVGVSALSTDITEHQAYSKLRTQFAQNTDALQRLGQLMAESEDYWLGKFIFPEDKKLSDYLESLAKLTSLPGWAIVKSAYDARFAKSAERAISDIQENLLPELCKSIDANRLKLVLHEIPKLGRDKKLITIFNIYLKILAANDTFEKPIIGSLHLLACDNTWQKTEHLCAGVEGVDLGHLLDPDQAKILKNIIHSGGIKNTTSIDESIIFDKPKDYVHGLEEYFKTWRDSMPAAPIGGLFALLGPAFQELARDWIKPHSIENLIESIEWNDPSERNSRVWDYTKSGGYQKSEAFKMLDFIPVISDDEVIAVQSLLGLPIKVKRSKQYDNLIVGNITWVGTRTGRNAFKLPLRMLTVNDLSQTDKSRLSSLIRKTCASVLKEAYNQRSSNLDAWDSLEKSDQLELEVARELILDRLQYDLSDIIKTTRRNNILHDTLKKLESLKTDRADKNLKKKSIAEVERSIVSTQLELAHLMSSNTKIQATVLNGIRGKVKENQYRESSVAFELLQNADDAVLELQLLIDNGAATNYSSDALARFVVESNGKTVRFLHWGRPVNFMGHGAGRNDSYGKDLQRMLVLAASDKEDSSGVTGKFGLGFKSVLLATDMPCIVSGDLKVKILGGCLPEPWSEADGALKALQKHRLSDAASPRGTVIEFRVVDGVQPDAVLKRFAALAGLQCVFSKKIRTIDINGQQHNWSPLFLAGISKAEVGQVQLPAKSGSSTSKLLNLRLDNACLAFRLDSRGCATFNAESEFLSPSVWVTAPTSEAPAVGVILNGPFTLDTGRGGLPHAEGAETNLKFVTEFGRNIAELVRQLIVATKKAWPDARTTLGLNKDVTPGEFWSSFLNCILRAKDRVDANESERLLARLAISFYELYLASTEEIPNGLPGEWSRFVQLTRINLSLDSRWAKQFSKLKNIAALVNMPPVEGWVSEAVAEQLKASNKFNNNDIPKMSVERLLDCIPQNQCSPIIAKSLADFLTDLTDKENFDCTKKLKELYFQAKDGSWKSGVNLLKVGCPEDAPYIAFAPQSALLDAAYEGAGLEIIVKFAPCNSIATDIVAKYILNAKTSDARIGALRYLLIDSKVRSFLNNKITGSWLEKLSARSQYLSNFSLSEKNQLLVMFRTELVKIEEVNDINEQKTQLKQGREALSAIHEWWQNVCEQELKKFDDEFWPRGITKNFSDEYDNRAAWMTLFAIGLMQRYGRVKNTGNRSYIELMQSKGWWEVFSNIDPHTDGQAWLNVLNEYGKLQDDHEKFSMWMDSFPRLYRIARWFDNYKHVFESLDARSLKEVVSLTSPNADPVLDGSGIYAPSLVRGLKLGQHVIIRELLRRGVLKSETAKSLAFKPSSRIKEFLSKIGFSDFGGKDIRSQDIYNTLRDCLDDGASFNGAYDIPLQIIALDTNLQKKILGAVAMEDGEQDEY
jgi:hypothetical protein